jgi:hypothetical protein
MSLQLKNATASQFPPSGWPFSDPKTGMKFNGWEGTPQMQAVKIAAHRRANPKFYPDGAGQDSNAIIQELYQQKFSSAPWLFVGQPDKDPAQGQSQGATIIIGEKCSCGSTEWIPEYCKTCSGRRVIGRKCASCGRTV